MTATELRREVVINGEHLRLADVLNWAEKQPEGDFEDEGATQQDVDARILVGYLLHRAAIDLCGRGGVIVGLRVNTWSRDGDNEDVEVTVGRPAPPISGATWTDCRRYWFYRRTYEIEPAAKALDLYRRYRKAERDLYTERVEVDHYARGGGPEIETDRFWIAIKPYVAGYADDNYRISHAEGRGKTKTEALLAAISPVSVS